MTKRFELLDAEAGQSKFLQYISSAPATWICNFIAAQPVLYVAQLLQNSITQRELRAFTHSLQPGQLEPTGSLGPPEGKETCWPPATATKTYARAHVLEIHRLVEPCNMRRR